MELFVFGCIGEWRLHLSHGMKQTPLIPAGTAPIPTSRLSGLFLLLWPFFPIGEASTTVSVEPDVDWLCKDLFCRSASSFCSNSGRSGSNFFSSYCVTASCLEEFRFRELHLTFSFCERQLQNWRNLPRIYIQSWPLQQDQVSVRCTARWSGSY